MSIEDMTFTSALNEAISAAFPAGPRKKRGQPKTESGLVLAAKKLGISKVYLNLLLNGDRPPPRDELIVRIAKLIGIETAQIKLWLVLAARDRYKVGEAWTLWNELLLERKAK